MSETFCLLIGVTKSAMKWGAMLRTSWAVHTSVWWLGKTTGTMFTENGVTSFLAATIAVELAH